MFVVNNWCVLNVFTLIVNTWKLECCSKETPQWIHNAITLECWPHFWKEVEENHYVRTLHTLLEIFAGKRYVTMLASLCGKQIFISPVKLSERLIRDISCVEECSRREHGRSADRVLSQDKREDLTAAQTQEMDMRKETRFTK